MPTDIFAPQDVNPAALHPIIYVRGFAMTRSEINETTADPFCGFNIGSTVFRAKPERDAPARKFIFESPVVRLGKDFGYRDVFLDGDDLLQNVEWQHGISRRSVVVYRYYDPASTLLGEGKTPPIEAFGAGLSSLIARVKQLTLDRGDYENPDDFRCYLVAHSMGGLVCRAFLQNPKCDPEGTRTLVDKFFTYATPHNGIDLGGINVPSWLTKMELDNFNRDSIAEYLHIEPLLKKHDRVDWLPEEALSPDRVFCLIGTNRLDYESAAGLSRSFAGHGSDGLVRIENAWLRGTRNGEPLPPTTPIAKAFVYRAHSGFFGIVNSEEAYQNLTRFLFGDVRVDIWVDIEELTLPPAVRDAAGGKTVNALYQLELLASPRGKLWYLTRRVAEEDSVACLTHRDYVAAQGKPVPLYVSTVFLSQRAKIVKERPTLAYSLTLGIRVPDYEIDHKLWLNDHFEGGYVFRDSVVVELMPPDPGEPEGPWKVRHDWQADGKVMSDWTPLAVDEFHSGTLTVPIPFVREKIPGARGQIRFKVRRWNA